MAPRNPLRKMLPWGRKKKDGKESAATSPVIQTIPHPSPARTHAGDKPQAQVTHAAGTGPRPHEQPAPTASATPSPRPPPAPTASPRDGSPDTLASTPPIQPEPLWNRAYDALKEEDHDLVDTYEKLLSCGLEGDPGSTDLTLQKNEIEQKNPAERRSQMTRLVEAGLKKIENEATVKQNIEKRMLPLSSAKRVIDTAVTASPEASLAWAGVCCVLQILTNPVTETSANRDGIAYIISRIDWYQELSKLFFQESKDETSLAGLRDELKKHVIDLYKLLLSYQMKSVCSYYRHRGIVFVWDMITPGKWADALQAVHDAEKTVQQDIERHSTEEIKSHLRDLVESAKSLQEELLPGFRQALQDQTRLQEKRYQDDKDEQCLTDLHETDPSKDKKRIQRAKGGLLRDSYRWILDNGDFRRFRDDPRSRLLWIKGDPGKGKTMLLCGIIDELEKESANRLSYFFCQATEAQLSNATAVLRGLIYLLIVQQPSLISYVRVKYDISREKLFEGINVWVSLTEILTDMLKDPTLENLVLVVDALDECRTDLPQLLDFIAQSSSSSRAKWIVSSRNRPDIEAQLEDAQKVRIPLELNKDSISNAVHTYIRYKVDQLAREKKYDDKTRDAVQHHLTSNANDTFLWVALVCRELADPKVFKRHTLAKLTTFPPGLDSLYKRMMEHIYDSYDADVCKQILAVVSVAYRPITLKELTSFIEALDNFDNDLDVLKEIVGCCGSFLTVRGEVLDFVHLSAKDFLLTNAAHEILPSGIGHQHHAIFSRSLEALSRTLRRDIYSLRAPGFPIDQVTPPNPDPLASTRYSCMYWVDHLCDSDPVQRNGHDKALQDGGAVHTFLQDKYLFWLESLSLLRSMSEGVMAVQKLEALVKSMEARQLTELLRDARRFILSHKRAMEIAPLQVYTSALVFSPTRSVVRELFQKEEPDWITLKPSMESDWNACLQTLEGHDDSVSSVVFSTDGHRLASSSGDRTIKVWDAGTGACLQTLKGHGGWVSSVVFSADSQRLASSSHDNTIKIWDTATGACLQTLEGHDDSVSRVVFSTDGHRLASSSIDRTIKVWDAATGACLQTLKGHGGWVWSVVFSADGQRLASSSDDRTIKVWDAATGACLQTHQAHHSSGSSCIFSADGQRLALSPRDRTIEVWDAGTGACLQTLEGHDDSVSRVVFSADGQRLASSSKDNTIKIWDASSGACLQTLERHRGWVLSAVFSADGHRLASHSDDNTIKIWDASSGACLQTLKGHGSLVQSVIFSADGQRLASSSDDRTIKVWDAATGACLQTLKGHGGWVWSVVFSADGHWLASSSDDRTIKVWDAGTGACLQTLKGHGSWVRSVVFSADGHWLASSSDDRTIKVWDAATGACLQTLEGHGGWVSLVVFSADGQRLASSSYDRTIKVWDAATGACLQTLQTHQGRDDSVSSIIFSADGQRLASSSYDRTIKVWDASSGACLQTFDVGRVITHLSFDPMTNSRLSTDIGVLNLDLSSANASHLTGASLHCGYGVSTDGIWIVKGRKRLLWLPPEYRALNSAVTGSTVAMGCRSGRVLVMRFSVNGPDYYCTKGGF